MNQAALTARSNLLPPRAELGRCPRCGRRHGLSRRRLLRAAAGVSFALGAGVHGMGHVGAQAASAGPKPIPGGIDIGDGNLIHVYDYSQGFEPATITDFLGFVGFHHLRGEGTVTKGGGGDGIATPAATGDRELRRLVA